MGKKLMILGAGIYQVPLIQKARNMGLQTIVVSIPGDYPGFMYADKIYYEDTRDYETILKIAKKENIDGIVTAGTDVAVCTIGKVCDEMGLSGLSFEAGKMATDKMQMKKRYIECGVRTAQFRPVDICCKDILQQIKELRFPLIFKAVDSSGSRGIVRVDTVKAIDEALAAVRKNTKKNYFIVEEFLEGEEFGAQAFIYHSKVQFILPHGDFVFQGDTGVPVGHWVPFELDAAVLADAKRQLQLAVDAMQLDNCAINADFILVDGKTYVLEIGGRAGATCLPELVSIYYHYNYYEKIILAALGEDVDFRSDEMNPSVGMLLQSDKNGTIKKIINHNDLFDPDIVDLQFDYQAGQAVSKFWIGPDRIGHVIVKGNTVSSAKKKMQEVLGKIEIVVE
ncbi:MAG: ATP-grasp domain-containing protein [Clostridiaceae bacterium]|nr:ATP-grasp domain-containing protein [Clostridiaceae bacterium]